MSQPTQAGSIGTRVVVLGATGHFGNRIARRLTGDASLQLIVTSRSRRAAEVLAAELSTYGSPVAASALDQNSDDFRAALAALRPAIVVHTAGPYQGQDYRVARACIECRSHYIDLADGRQFVKDFSELHAQALANGVLLVSGASTLPGLSSVVVSEVLESLQTVTAVESSIAPAHQTPRGIGTVAAVLSYCGRPFESLVGGRWRRVFGWQDLKAIRYDNLGLRLAAACDVPDLELMPQRLDGIETVTFHAALEAKWEQLSLWLLAAAVRFGIVRDCSKFAQRFKKISDRFLSFGSDRGGMQIDIAGVDTDGCRKLVRWVLTAERNHGPEVPCTPALVIVRKLSGGELKSRGAMPCWNLFTLQDFDRETTGLDIRWRFEDRAWP